MDAKEIAKLDEGNVHVDLAEDADVMFYQCFFKDAVAIAVADVLVGLERLLEFSHVLSLHDLSHEHFLEQPVELEALGPDVIE